MKKTQTIVLLLLLAFPAIVTAQTKELSYKFGGFVEFKSYFDDYRSRTSRYDLQYKYPLSPDLNNSGIDTTVPLKNTTSEQVRKIINWDRK